MCVPSAAYLCTNGTRRAAHSPPLLPIDCHTTICIYVYNIYIYIYVALADWRARGNANGFCRYARYNYRGD